MRTYNLIRPDSIPSDMELVLDISDFDKPRSRQTCYRDDAYLVVYRSSHGNDTSDLLENQLELPISALSWIVESIENGFWAKNTNGGFPKNKHGVNSVFDGEEVLVVRSMNAGTNKPGFKVVNKSRSSHIFSSRPQNFTFTDEFAKKHFLPLLKK